MAQKRIQYVKTATGVEKQLIASSADIVEVEKIDGLNATNVQDALEELSTIAAEGGVTSVNGKTGAVTLTKSDIDLGNVTNDAQVKRSEMGVAGGVATLGTDGKVPTSQLPSYVDDVVNGYYNIEGDKLFYHTKQFTQDVLMPADDGKIYVDIDTNKTYRWNGSSAYVEISASLALGETSSTAYAGDKGKANAENIAALQETVEEMSKAGMDKLTSMQFNPPVLDDVVLGSSTIYYAGQANLSTDGGSGYEINYETELPISAGANITFTKDTDTESVKINAVFPNTGVSAGTYSAVSVDEKGRVTAGSQIIEWGTSGQSVPSNNLAVGGLFFALVE